MFCQDCGNKIPENAKFCPFCGFKFQAEKSSPPPFTLTKSKPAQPENVTAEKNNVPEKPVQENTQTDNVQKKLTLEKSSGQADKPEEISQTGNARRINKPLTINIPQTNSQPVQQKPVSYPQSPAPSYIPPQNDSNLNAAPMTYDRNAPQRVNYSAANVVNIKKNSKAPTVIIIILIILMLAGAGVFVYFQFFHNKTAQNDTNSQSKSSAVSDAGSSAPDTNSTVSDAESTAPVTSDLDMRALCYDCEHYNYSFTTIAADDSFIEIDTNPLDQDGYDSSKAEAFIKELNMKLGFGDSLFTDMMNTTDSDGSKIEENDDIRVKWRNETGTGLVVRYIKK